MDRFTYYNYKKIRMFSHYKDNIQYILKQECQQIWWSEKYKLTNIDYRLSKQLIFINI